MMVKNSSAYVGLLLYVCSACMLWSCSRESNSETNQDASLVVRVSGLEDYVVATTPVALSQKNKIKQSSTSDAASQDLFSATEKPRSENEQHEMQFSNDFDVDFEIVKAHPAAALPDEPRPASKNASSMSAQRSLMARQPLGNAVRYRLLIYRENDTEPIVNTEATGSTFPEVAIASGFNYRWVAVSTNETSSTPAVSNNVVSASDIANKDFLYASGTFFSEFGQNFLNIVFKRYTSQIQLTVDSRGMFGNIAPNSMLSFTISTGGTLSETADFNVQDSSFSNFQPVALDANNMTNTDPALRTGTIYTVRSRPVAAGSLQLRLNPLVLTLDDGSTRTFADNTYNFGSAFSPVRGSSYTISARLIESGVRVGSSPIRWARSNLTYQASAPDGFRYRFRPHPVNYIFDANVDLWNFGSSVPTNTYEGVEACRQVYPANTWKYPDANDLAQLGNPNTIEGYTLPGTGNPGIVANWDRSPTQPASSAYPGMDQLRLPFYGYRTTANTMTRQPALNGTQLTGEGNYFSRNFRTIQTTPTIRVYPLYLRMQYSGPNLTGSTTSLAGYSQSFVTNDSNSEYEGRSIRCIRVVNP